MARPASTDPLRNFKFQVTIVPASAGLRSHVGDEIGNLGFTVVSGLTVQNEVINYREGGMNTHPHKMPGQSDYGPVTFSKGVFGHERSLWQWETFLKSWNQGGGTSGGSTSGNNDFRCDIIVKVFDHPVSSGNYASAGNTAQASTPAGGIKLAYKLHEAWPGSYALTDLNAGDNGIMIQQLVVHHEGFDIAYASGPNEFVTAQQIANL